MDSKDKGFVALWLELFLIGEVKEEILIKKTGTVNGCKRDLFRSYTTKRKCNQGATGGF